MKTSIVTYAGNLRTECLHEQSQALVITDAPRDNQGKGEAFSPTDLLSTSLASCMLTIMGIWAKRHDIALEGTRAEVLKTMASDPRRVQGIAIDIHFPAAAAFWTTAQRTALEHAARTCPVALSLRAEIEQQINFVYPNE